MLSEAHLTSHSRMSDSRWVIPVSWLSGSWRSFLYSSSIYSCHLFLISSASFRSIPFRSFIVPIFARNVPLVSLIFIEEISSLSHSVVFLYFFALITEEVFLISPRYSSFSAFRWVYLSFSPLPFTSILFTAICKASPDRHFTFLSSFPWGWSWSLSPVQCHEPPNLCP